MSEIVAAIAVQVLSALLIALITNAARKLLGPLV
jgi:hypothetical protein